MSMFAVCFSLTCKVSESSNFISHGRIKADRKFMSLVLCNPNIITKLRLLISFQCIQGFNMTTTGNLNKKIAWAIYRLPACTNTRKAENVKG